MNKSTLKKIKKSSEITPSMLRTFDKFVADWVPDLPPVTMVFGWLEDSFINNLESQSEHQNQLVFDAVEVMITGDDKDLDIGVSTGFLEATVDSPNFNKKAKSMLEKESRDFLIKFNEFSGIEDADLQVLIRAHRIESE